MNVLAQVEADAEFAWSWDDVSWDDADLGRLYSERTRRKRRTRARDDDEERKGPIFGGALRPPGRTTRFLGTASHALREDAALRADHPAILEGRSLFQKSVHDANASPRLFIGGHNNAKIGRRIEKGPWRGLAVYTFALEERATCPTSCGLWNECMGNAMPFARRHRPGPDLIPAIRRELDALARKHPHGFAIRLHVLGDFYSPEYLQSWFVAMDDYPGLHVWGYTAHPMTSPQGIMIDAGNDVWPERWAFRFSVADHEPAVNMTVTSIWRQPDGPVVEEGLVCPAQTGRTESCSTCALCWSPAMADTRIVFIGHGTKHRRAA